MNEEAIVRVGSQRHKKSIQIKGWVSPRDTVEWLHEKILPSSRNRTNILRSSRPSPSNIPTEPTLLIYQIRTVI